MGYPFGFDFTEALFVGVNERAEKKIALLSFILMDGSKITVVANAVERLLLNDFLEQNIVDELIIYDRFCERDKLINCLDYLLGTDENTRSAYMELIEKLTDGILSGMYSILEIVPVYGAKLCVLAESFRPIESASIKSPL